MYRIAVCLCDPDKEYGVKPTEEDYAEAVACAQKAVDDGEDNANYVLGYLHMIGKGLPKDYNKAVSYFTKAANFGNSRAKDKLKRFTRSGSGNYIIK